jgi:UDP-glucose 4-epimerase
VVRPARLVRGAIEDQRHLEHVLREERIEAVLHCAAKSLVGESLTDPALYYRNNVGGGVTLLEAMRHTGVNRLVFSSTAAVYGEPRRVPIAESDRTEPINPYGASKLAFEGAMRWFVASHDFQAISLRYFNVAGATERNGEDHEPETHLMPIMLKVAAGEATHVQIFGQDYPTPDGTCIRDFVHVADIASAHVAAAAALGDGELSALTANIGRGEGVSVREMVETIRSVTGTAGEEWSAPAVVDRRPGDPARVVASADVLQGTLGWKSRFDVREMVESAWAGWNHR